MHAGEVIPPHIIFKKSLPERVDFVLSGPEDALYSATRHGYMDSDKWLDYLVHFDEHVPGDVVRPIVLYLDGLDSHISAKSLDFCFDHNIIIVQFVAHTSHVCQPADRTIFKGAKSHIGNLEKLLSLVLPQGTTIDKTKFPSLLRLSLEKIYDAPRNPWTVGFECTGLYPFDVNRVCWSELIKGIKSEAKRGLIQEFVVNYHRNATTTFGSFCLTRLPAAAENPLQGDEGIELPVSELGKSLIKSKKLPAELVELFRAPPARDTVRIRKKESTLKASALKELYDRRLQQLREKARPTLEVTRTRSTKRRALTNDSMP